MYFSNHSDDCFLCPHKNIIHHEQTTTTQFNTSSLFNVHQRRAPGFIPTLKYRAPNLLVCSDSILLSLPVVVFDLLDFVHFSELIFWVVESSTFALDASWVLALELITCCVAISSQDTALGLMLKQCIILVIMINKEGKEFLFTIWNLGIRDR